MHKQMVLSVLACLSFLTTPAWAEIIGVNWADEVVEYTPNIQNYAGVLLSADTAWWLTGPADCDCDDNGYVWDPADQDTVAGWRAAAPNESVTMYWSAGIPDLPGDDLAIHVYGGPIAAADVFASVDGSSFELVGAIGGGTPGYLREETFDFAGVFASDVQYVKVVRTASGPQTGMFFDAFSGVVPEPASLLLLCWVGLGLRRR